MTSKNGTKAPHDLRSSLGVIAVIQGEVGGSCSRHLGGEKCVKCAVRKP